MTRKEISMFPTNWNDPYRKKDGTLVNMEELGDGGGGGSELPDYSQADAGKVLTVGEDGELEWNEAGSNIYARTEINTSFNIESEAEEVSA